MDARLMVETTAGDGDADGTGCRREREGERRESGDEDGGSVKWVVLSGRLKVERGERR